MYTDGLMDSKSHFNSAARDRFREAKIWIYFSIVPSSFRCSDEEKWVVTERRGSIVKCRETSFEGERFLKIRRILPCMTVIKMERKAKQKRGRYGVGNRIKTKSNVGSVSKLNPGIRPFDEVKKRKCKLLY